MFKYQQHAEKEGLQNIFLISFPSSEKVPSQRPHNYKIQSNLNCFVMAEKACLQGQKCTFMLFKSHDHIFCHFAQALI